MKLYLAGPMTGLPDLNFPAFHAEAARLRALGYTVINPAEVNPDHGKPWADCMRSDIAALVTCDSVAMLDGWTASKGARLEHHIGLELGMQPRLAAFFVAPPHTERHHQEAETSAMPPDELQKKTTSKSSNCDICAGSGTAFGKRCSCTRADLAQQGSCHA